MLAPFGVGVLVAREHLLEASLPFLYGGDMVAEGPGVRATGSGYNALPWKYAAGTPNIIGTIVSAQALRLLLDLALTPTRAALLRQRPARSNARRSSCAMGRVADWNRQADRTSARAARRDPGDHDLRAARRGAPQLARRLQRAGPRSGRAGAGVERRRGRSPRGVPLRDARAPGARHRRELSSELLPLQHPRRGRPRGRRAGRRSGTSGTNAPTRPCRTRTLNAVLVPSHAAARILQPTRTA